jgi:mono/diheme cytochrome c family protein
MNFRTVLWFLVFALGCQAQQTPPPSRLDYNMRLLAGSRSGPETEGHKLFAQRCSVCHVGGPTEVPYGGWLNSQRIQRIGDDAARQLITEGTSKMPGWKYTLSATQVEQILAYLKTVRTTKKVEPLPGRQAVIER